MTNSNNLVQNAYGEESLRERLQVLLDDKEKQLQLAGTLGQRILAQQMELEDRINQLPIASSSLLSGDDPHTQEEVRNRLNELEAVISSWETENSVFFSKIASQSSNPKFDSPDELNIFQAAGSAANHSPPESNQPSAIQSSRRAKNAAHRADDVEFAFEIGSGLLTEVRRLQSLLGERDKAIQDMKEEKDDLERSMASLRSNLHSQEQNTDRFKEENWNLEVALQELRTQAGDLQSSNNRLEGEQKRLFKQLTNAREAADKFKAETESLNSSLGDLKAKHETDIAQMRKNAASLQRDKSDLQVALDSMKTEVERRNRGFRSHGSEQGLPKVANSTSLEENGELEADNIPPPLNPPSPVLHPSTSEDALDHLDHTQSPLLNSSATNLNFDEFENLKRNYLHAQRQIASLKNSLMKEKELRLDQKKKRALPEGEHDDSSNIVQGESDTEGDEVMRDKATKRTRRRKLPDKPRRLTTSTEAGQKRIATDHPLVRSSTSSSTDGSGLDNNRVSQRFSSDIGLENLRRENESEDFDPAFLPSTEEQHTLPHSMAHPPQGVALTKTAPTDLALELGLSQEGTHKASETPVYQETYTAELSPILESGFSGVESSSISKGTSNPRRGSPTVTDQQTNRINASAFTISRQLADVASQTEVPDPGSLVSDISITGMNRDLQRLDRASQTESLDHITGVMTGASSRVSNESLPFRFISPHHRFADISSSAQASASVAQDGFISPATSGDSFHEVPGHSKSPRMASATGVVDKTIPPTLALPPPPKAPPPANTSLGKSSSTPSQTMPPPSKIPEKRTPIPPRPLSPPPRELIQRATTPLSLHNIIRSSRQELPTGFTDGLSDYRSERSVKAHEQAASHGRQHSSSASFVSDFHSSNPSRRSSLSSNHFHSRREPLVGSSFSATQRIQSPGNNYSGATDPNIIHAITQTMIGEFLYKYTRRTIGKGYGDKRHKRYFWVHPYTKTIYWSSSDPSAVGVSESNAKSAFIESVRSVLDPNPLPPGIYQYSVVVSTPQREMKFTAPSKERHDIWITALNFLLSRPATLSHSPEVHRAEQRFGNPANVVPSPVKKPDGFGVFSSPQSGRTLGSTFSSDTWNITPRAHHAPSTPLSQIGSIRKRPGTPAAEYMRWGSDAATSPERDFEQIAIQPGEADFDFEIHDDFRAEGDFDGLENVRTCCDGAHTIGKHHHDDHLHNVETRRGVSTSHTHIRPISPSGWSFRSKAGSSQAK